MSQDTTWVNQNMQNAGQYAGNQMGQFVGNQRGQNVGIQAIGNQNGNVAAPVVGNRNPGNQVKCFNC